MHPLRRIIHEAHRRSLWQVVAIYGVGSWAAYQVIGDLTQRLALPDWVPGFAIVLFLIGLPIVVATAFVQEGIPGQAPKQRGGTEPSAENSTIAPAAEQPARPDLERRAPAAPDAARPHIFLTWHRAIAAGITAFLLLGVTAAGYVGLRNAGVGPFASLLSAGTIAERDRLIVAQFEAAGQPDSAIAYYREYIDSPDMERGQDESWNLPLAYERVAELYEKNGDRENAGLAAARFVQLWDRADAQLQPRVQAKQQMLQRLRRS